MISPMLYPTLRQARSQPDHPALIGRGECLSYHELEERIATTARCLQTLNVNSGDIVAVAAPNSCDWVVCAHSVWRCGAVLLPLDPHLPQSRWHDIIATFAPTLIVTDSDLIPPNQIPVADVAGLTELSQDMSPDCDLREEIDPNALHTLILTSGTTGTPRGVCLTFGNHVFAALASALNLGIHTDDRWLVNLPLYHIGGLAIVLRAALYGTTVVIRKRFDATATWRAIQDDRVTQLSLVPTMLRRLLDVMPDDAPPEWLRTILVGGGHADVALLREARARGLPVLTTYGMTETASQCATLHPASQKFGTVGVPLQFCELSIRNASGVAVPDDTSGIIHLRGPMVSDGYWIGPDEILPTGSDGWLATRDIGRCDSDGDLTVLGRSDNVIITGGRKVCAEEVETALMQLPGVQRAAVIGVEDPEWGQAIVALIEIGDGATVATELLKRQLSEQLEEFKLPKRISVVSALPTTTAGKIDRTRLTELVRSVQH